MAAGPNTGGKTASLKALGLAALAARCGLPVPVAVPAKLPCFDAVLADIGEEQSTLVLHVRWLVAGCPCSCQAAACAAALNAILSNFSDHLPCTYL